MADVESQIAEWRTYLSEAAVVERGDIDELEAHLRDQIDELDSAGLTDDEAFLVAVKRMGSIDSLTREFAREHSGRLWKQLVLQSGLLANLNTDDPAISGIDLRHEYEVAAPAAGLTPAMARRAQANALEMAFLPDDEKRDLQRRKRAYGADSGISTARGSGG